jgi:hypothetical protein
MENWWGAPLRCGYIPNCADVLEFLAFLKDGSHHCSVDFGQALAVSQFVTRCLDANVRQQIGDALYMGLTSENCQARNRVTQLILETRERWPEWIGPSLAVGVCAGLADRCRSARRSSALAVCMASMARLSSEDKHFEVLCAAKNIIWMYGLTGDPAYENVPPLRVLKQHLPHCQEELDLRHSLPCRHRQ